MKNDVNIVCYHTLVNFPDREQAINFFRNSINNSKDIGILVINNNIFNLMPDEFKKIEKRQLPLLLKID